jgi:ubiquinone/menaquinone biosynthesis C-methylase UbiE
LIAVFIPKLILKAIRFHRKRNRFYLCDLDRTTPAKLLEIGCGSGDRIIKLNKAGWDVIGQDIDNNAYEKLTSNNIPFILGNTDQLKGEQFDVILLSHVIEHVKDPVSLLKECRRLLKSNGKLYITTPNNQSFTHKLFRRYWLGLDSPRHLIVYNINSLTNILSSSGYKNIKARTIAVNTEIFAMHSIDILRYKWTNVYSAPRIGKEFIPVFLQLTLFILNCITRVHGDECFVIASK